MTKKAVLTEKLIGRCDVNLQRNVLTQLGEVPHTR